MRSMIKAGLGALATVMLSSCIFLSIPLSGATSDYREIVLKAGHGPKVLVLDVDGVINSGATTPGPFFSARDSTVNEVAEKLAKARLDPSIKAIVLRVDSPGGGVTASDIVYKSLKDFKGKTNIPIYVSMLDLAASGGYYISMAGDEIYAHPTTITGSIGVIAMFPQFQGLGEKIGVYMEVLKSGKNKDITGGFHNMSPEQKAILQQMIDEMYGRFVAVVHEGRPKLSEEKIRELADGRIYTAQQAEANGLIDGVKYTDEVVELARARTGNAKAKVVLYRRSSQEKSDSVYAKSNPLPSMESKQNQTNVGLLNIDASGASAVAPASVFNYLWTP
ncbi:signal peptide peptidase SppA [soil metagenome]